jgi:hypothetical protein
MYPYDVYEIGTEAIFEKITKDGKVRVFRCVIVYETEKMIYAFMLKGYRKAAMFTKKNYIIKRLGRVRISELFQRSE